MPTDYQLNGFAELKHADREHVWHPFTSLSEETLPPLLIQSARGVHLTTSDGKDIIDAVSSWWVNIHGHSHPAIARAIFTQAQRLEHVIFAGFTHEPAIRLALNLLKILPPNQQRIFFSDNGSTAVEVALKMALQYWYNLKEPRKKIVVLQGAYHGDTFGSMALGERGNFTRPFHPFLFDVAFIDVPSEANIEQTIQKFKTIAATNEVAAFVYEPLVQGAAGMVMYSPEHLNQLLREAKRNRIICIADEVFTGFGRTGTLFASSQCETQPDIMAISKGITGGTMPLGVTSCSAEIESAFRSREVEHTFFHGHSYTANPIACAAALASFDLLMDPQCIDAIRRISFEQKEFADSVREHPSVRESRSCGTILAIEIRTAHSTSYFNQLRGKIYNFFLDRNILLRPLGNVVYVLPPYIITTAELKVVHDSISAFLDKLEAEKVMEETTP